MWWLKGSRYNSRARPFTYIVGFVETTAEGAERGELVGVFTQQIGVADEVDELARVGWVDIGYVASLRVEHRQVLVAHKTWHLRQVIHCHARTSVRHYTDVCSAPTPTYAPELKPTP